jgi:hypothetical protein
MNEPSPRPEGAGTQAVRLATVLKGSFVALPLLCVPLQAMIDLSSVNVACACIVAASSLMVVLYLSLSRALETHPLSTFVLFGFCCTTQLGALVVQTLSWTSVSASLYDPIYTFGALAFYQSIAVGTHVLYRYFTPRYVSGNSPLRTVLARCDMYRIPSVRTLWIFGGLGLGSFYSSNGHAIYNKLSDAANFLVWAPFLIPYYWLVKGDSYCNVSRAMRFLALYAILIALMGIAINARATMFAGVATVTLLFLLHGFRTPSPLKPATVVKVLILAAVFALLMEPLSDFVTAMALARDSRGKISPVEMVGNTFYFLGRPDLIRGFNEKEKADELTGYDESYIANGLLARLVETKFHDNALHFARRIAIEEDRDRLWNVTTDSLWAALPTPVLKLLHVSINKDDLQFSVGDYLVYLSRGQQVGGYRTGSVFAQGLVLFGPVFPLVYSLACLLVFHVLELMTAKFASGPALVSAPAMMNTWPYFLHGITADSVEVFFSFVLRGLVQMLLIYFAAICVARALSGNKNVFA